MNVSVLKNTGRTIIKLPAANGGVFGAVAV